MLRVIIGIAVVLHGLVHLLYLGQSWRLFELKPGLIWPDGAWAFTRPLGTEVTRRLASIACGLAAAAFIASGLGILVGQTWWYALLVGAALFSAVLYIFFWDGKMIELDANGGIGLLIDMAILASLLVLHWPTFGS